MFATLKNDKDRFSTLIELIRAVELRDTLRTISGATLFAPTNEAFEALPDGALINLMDPDNREQLREVLLDHVLGVEYTAEELLQQNNVTALSGAFLDIDDGSLFVNDSEVIISDLFAENGVIHVIDQLIGSFEEDEDAEGEPENIYRYARLSGNFDVFTSLLRLAGLNDDLKRELNDVTVFAPDDEAFNRLSQSQLRDLRRARNRNALRNLLLHHIVDSELETSDIRDFLYLRLRTMSRDFVFVREDDDGRLLIDNAHITIANKKLVNGILHRIDRVLVPSDIDLNRLSRGRRDGHVQPEGLEKYYDLAAAIDDGYEMEPCVPNQGVYYVNQGLIDDTVNMTEPEALIYGSVGDVLHYLGVEYLATEQFSLFGEEAYFIEDRALYGLHGWFFEENANGLHARFHSNVNDNCELGRLCPAGEQPLITSTIDDCEATCICRVSQPWRVIIKRA